MEKKIVEIDGVELDYTVYSSGEVFSHKSNRFLKPSMTGKRSLGKRYPVVSLFYNGYQIPIMLSKLVATAFIENPEGFDRIIYLDGDPSNCDVSNLKWGSEQDQLEYGSSHNFWERCKLSPEKVRKIDSMPTKAASKEMNISYGAAWNAQARKTWSFVK